MRGPKSPYECDHVHLCPVLHTTSATHYPLDESQVHIPLTKTVGSAPYSQTGGAASRRRKSVRVRLMFVLQNSSKGLWSLISRPVAIATRAALPKELCRSHNRVVRCAEREIGNGLLPERRLNCPAGSSFSKCGCSHPSSSKKRIFIFQQQGPHWNESEHQLLEQPCFAPRAQDKCCCESRLPRLIRA